MGASLLSGFAAQDATIVPTSTPPSSGEVKKKKMVKKKGTYASVGDSYGGSEE